MRFVILDGRAKMNAVRLIVSSVAVAVALSAVPLRAQDPGLPAPPVTDTVAREVGTVRQGDVLTVNIYNDAGRSGIFVINSSGIVSMPGIGRLRVAGLTPEQVDRAIHDALLKTYQVPSFSVTIQIRVSVGGEVSSPNMYAVEPGTTLLQILTIAGGGTEQADLRRARVLRGNQAYTVDLESALEGSASGDIVLFSNDAVIVGRRRGLTRENVAFVLGGITAILSLVNVVVSLRR
jgi:polysaccharide export outer membrane protein